MKSFSPINLDCENTLGEFITTYKTTNGRRLANLLNLRGKGSTEKGYAISGYAWNKHTAILCRKEGKIIEAQMYEGICERIYSRMSEDIKW